MAKNNLVSAEHYASDCDRMEQNKRANMPEVGKDIHGLCAALQTSQRHGF